MEPFTARQGDVYIRRVGTLPAGAKLQERDAGRVVLAYGEVTGHAHAIYDEHADLYLAGEDLRTYLVVTEAPATVRHEEHRAIVLTPDVYEVRIQREYSPGAIRLVAD